MGDTVVDGQEHEEKERLSLIRNSISVNILYAFLHFRLAGGSDDIPCLLQVFMLG